MTKPTRTGYEAYKGGNIGDLQVDPSLWGAPPSQATPSSYGFGRPSSYDSKAGQQTPLATPTQRKMMSLEEVEAQMRAQPKKPSAPPAVQQQQQQQQRVELPVPSPVPDPRVQHNAQPKVVDSVKYSVLQRPEHKAATRTPDMPQPSQIDPPQALRTPQILGRPQHSPQRSINVQESPSPRQILQNPRRHQAQPELAQVQQSSAPLQQVQALQNQQIHSSAGQQHQMPLITHPHQLMQLSEEDRASFLVEDAKRAKRNHKIYLLSKDNGLMTPQDKNFITRIQLQQLMTATGNVSEQAPDAALSEDFYYQVHSQIRGGPRQNPHQPLSHFAQTYLFQTSGRQGAHSRRQNRGGDNHMQRMEQQVQRAVEAAKLKPKNKQLVIEGSLGKISFSNAKTPKPLLNIRRAEGGDASSRPGSAGRQTSAKKLPQAEMSASDRKSVLKNIEAVYSTLMKMEDHERHLPPPPTEASDAAEIQVHAEWRHTMQVLNDQLWNELKVMEPINTGSSIPHPFIAFLSYPKGKKATPRVFRQIDPEQRVTILTMITVHLDILDVIRLGQLQPGETQLPVASREAVELFSQAVMPSLFGYVSEAPLNIVIGLLGVILDRVNVHAVARTKVGLSIFTMIISRAELIKQAGSVEDQEWEQWATFYNRLFDLLEPSLAGIFPGSVNAGEDMYVWQFLAAMGIGATPEQQQRLVVAVK